MIQQESYLVAADNSGAHDVITHEVDGILANIHFGCKGTGSGLISIIGGGGAQVSFYERPSIYGNRIFLAADPKGGKQLADAVLINCGGTAGAPAGDADGDGCPNVNEQQAAIGSEFSGGRRDFLNPFDYFNPTGDGLNRVDEILAVVNQYFDDAYLDSPSDTMSNPSYNPGTDRTWLGPENWALGPPNGLQRVDDILNALKQYFHDC